MRAPARCPRCRTHLHPPAPHTDGLPGILYRTCGACGYSAPITRKPRKSRLLSTKRRDS